MTFGENPQIVELADVSFANQIRMINQSDWGLNTNLYKALEYILKIAIENNCKNHELVTYLHHSYPLRTYHV